MKLPRAYRDEKGREVFGFSKEGFIMLADQIASISTIATTAQADVATIQTALTAAQTAATVDNPALATAVGQVQAVADAIHAIVATLTPPVAPPAA